MKLLRHKHNNNPYGLRMICGSPFSQVETKTYFRAINITEEELADLNEWIRDGNVFYRNPWHIYNRKGNMVNFIEASRAVKELHEDFTDQLYIPSTPITDSAFMYHNLSASNTFHLR